MQVRAALREADQERWSLKKEVKRLTEVDTADLRKIRIAKSKLRLRKDQYKEFKKDLE